MERSARPPGRTAFAPVARLLLLTGLTAAAVVSLFLRIGWGGETNPPAAPSSGPDLPSWGLPDKAATPAAEPSKPLWQPKPGGGPAAAPAMAPDAAPVKPVWQPRGRAIPPEPEAAPLAADAPVVRPQWKPANPPPALSPQTNQPAGAPPADATVWRPHAKQPVPSPASPPEGVQPTTAVEPDDRPALPPSGPGPFQIVAPGPFPPGRTLPTRLPDPVAPSRPGEGGDLSPPGDARPASHAVPASPLEGPAIPPPRALAAPNELPPPTPLPPPPEAKDKPDPDRALLLGAARNAVQQRNFDQALARFDDFFKRYGDDPDIRKEYAGVLVQAGRLRDALQEYRRLVARKPADLDLRVRYADVAVQAKDYPTATAQLRQALDLAPDDLNVAAKLARVYVFTEDFAQALKVYDQGLAALKAGDERAPRSLGALLIDLGRPEDAVPFLTAALEDHASDAELLTTLVRAYSAQGERAKAQQTLQVLTERAPHALAERQELGDALYAAGDYELAAAVYGQILQAEPDNAFALVGTARVHVQQFQPEQAHAVLDNVKPAGAAERVVLLTRAEYHQLVGEYLEAKQIYREFLRRDEADAEARLALAALDEFIREDEKAKAEYAKIPPSSPLVRKARIGFISTLTQQRRFPQAIEAARRLVADYPGDGNATARLVRTLDKAEALDEAEALARAYLRDNPRNEAGRLPVRLALGKVLLDEDKNQDAVHEYDAVLSRPAGRIPAAYYGMARALHGLGEHDKAAQVLAGITSPIGGDARNRLLLADLFSGDFDDAAAAETAVAVLKWEPNNLAALIRLADAQERLARMSGFPSEAIQTARAVLALSPTNVRGRLALARALTICRKFKESVAEYEALIAADAEFQAPQRERARVLYSDHQFDAGAAAYAQMQSPPADRQLQEDLAAYAQRDPRSEPLLGAYVKAGLPPDVLSAETAKVAATLGDPELQEGVRRIFLDHDARAAEQEGARLEGEVKDRSWQHYAVIPIARQLIDLEPSNTSALFDLGQDFSTLRQTRNALEQYSKDVHIDPGEYEAGTALERASLELRPQLDGGFDYFDQSGRDGLAQIHRTRYSSTAVLPFGDEDEFVSAGFTRAVYAPKNDKALQGNILSAAIQKKFCCDERLLIYGQANLETYRDRLKDRVTFDTGGRYDFCDLVTGRASLFLQNVVENGESLRQDIYRYGARVGADVRPARDLTFSGTYTVGHYSDRNDFNALFVKSDLVLIEPPRELKVVLSTDLYGYRNQTVFGDPGTSILIGTIHPYFAPHIYSYYEARLEWKHWISRDYFVHGNQCWYSFKYGVGWDDHMANFNTLEALANFDLRPWLSIGADAKLILSPVYDSTFAMAYAVVRLP